MILFKQTISLRSPQSGSNLLFRKGTDRDENSEQKETTEAIKKPRRIRCPHCRWSPDRSSRWTCWDCGHPEHFYKGCGTDWNTFDTHGLCPGCSYQWIHTTCLSCWGWAKHDDWYVD